MKLGFDATSLTAGGKGLARFQGEFLATLARLGLVDDLTVFAARDGLGLVPDVPSWRVVPVPVRPMILWEQVRLPAAARRLRLDVVIVTSERAALWGPPQIVYVYEHPRHRAELARKTGATPRQRIVDAVTLAVFNVAMRRAATVLTASQATARDLAPIRRAGVVYSATSEAFAPDDERANTVREELKAPDGYFLHLASDDPRDNSTVVIDAFALVAAARERATIVVAGSISAARPGLQRRAEEAGVADRIRWLGFRSPEELVDLYRGALAYVDPSLYEGFGLQALEALACGTPAIASNTTSLPEIVGDGGILVGPNDVPGFAGAMLEVLSDPILAADLRRRALDQARRFSWERTVTELLAAAEEVAGR